MEHGPVKVFADQSDKSEDYDKNSKLNVQRVSGFKIFRKYRKANLISEFVDKNEVRALFFDHWKSIENINQKILDTRTSFCLIHSKEINHISGSSLNKRMIKALSKTKLCYCKFKFYKKSCYKIRS